MAHCLDCCPRSAGPASPPGGELSSLAFAAAYSSSEIHRLVQLLEFLKFVCHILV